MNSKGNYTAPKWIAGISAALCGVAAHGFALANVLHNYDNILQQPKGYGAGITSGRWFLSILGDFCENVLDLGYNLGTINGLIFLAFVALSAVLIVDVLKIRSCVSSVLIGCLMVTFPTVCASMVFRYTVPYYGLALLLSVAAVWVAHRNRWGMLLAALCLAFSMGIYQAYPPVTISLFLLLLMQEALMEDARLKILFFRGLYACGCLILGVVLYFVLLRLSLALYSINGEVVLDSYQGIHSMGKISLWELPWLMKKAWTSAVLFPIRDYCGIAGSRPLKLLWTVLLLLAVVLALMLMWGRRKKPLNCAFFALMGLLLPLGINFIVVMAPEGIVYTIMVYSFVLAAVLPLMLLEQLSEGKEKRLLFRGIGILAAAIVFYNSCYANLNYTRLFYANHQVQNYFTGMAAQIRMTEGYTPDKKLVVIGDRIEDPNMWDIWNVGPVYGGFAGSSAKGLLQADYSVMHWIDCYLGLGFERGTEEDTEALVQNTRVQEMPCWPSEGSILVIEDSLVLKLQNIQG